MSFARVIIILFNLSPVDISYCVLVDYSDGTVGGVMDFPDLVCVLVLPNNKESYVVCSEFFIAERNDPLH
jgi:hypothetical protein